MHVVRVVGVLGACLWISASLAETVLFDELEQPNPMNWCTCRLDAGALVPMQENGVRFGRFVVGPQSVGGNLCTLEELAACRGYTPALHASGPPPAPTFPKQDEDDLGISLIGPNRPPLACAPAPVYPEGGPHCSAEIRERGAARNQEAALCIQREELTTTEMFAHPFDANARAFEYTIRFRMPVSVHDTTNSVRWVLAQWKQRDQDDRYRARFGKYWGPSPFMAQRYDDGILHVTVQDEGCRCVVASERSDKAPPAVDGTPNCCVSTDPGPSEGKPCTPRLKLKYSDHPYLDSPASRWTEMTYRIRAGRGDNSMIEISQDGHKVVEVTGPVGYDLRTWLGETVPTRVYFKVGHYRDFIPATDSMDVDWIRVDRLPPP